jgi:hypothetical protein
LHPDAGSCYTSEVLISESSSSGKITDLPSIDMPNYAHVLPILFSVVDTAQPQKIRGAESTLGVSSSVESGGRSEPDLVASPGMVPAMMAHQIPCPRSLRVNRRYLMPTNRDDSRPAITSPAPDIAGSATAATASSSVPVPTSFSAPASAPELVFALRTRLQAGIWKPKIFSDDTMRYGLLSATGEPTDLSSALSDPNWKTTMESEYSVFLKNNT